MTLTTETFEILKRYQMNTFTWQQQCVNKNCTFLYIRHLLSLKPLGTSKTSCVLCIQHLKTSEIEHINLNIWHIFQLKLSIQFFMTQCYNANYENLNYKLRHIKKFL